MAKTLNIEALAPSERNLNLLGTDYPVLEMTVENFLASVREAEALKDEKDIAKQVSAMVDTILRYVPSAPRELLVQLSMDQLGTILAFVQGQLEVDERGHPYIKGDEPTPAEAGEGNA